MEKDDIISPQPQTLEKKKIASEGSQIVPRKT